MSARPAKSSPNAVHAPGATSTPVAGSAPVPGRDGETGAGVITYVNPSSRVASPQVAEPTTVMSTIPVPAGETARISVSLMTVKLVAAVVPKKTPVAPVKQLPIIVTVVPPVVGPVSGVTSSILVPPDTASNVKVLGALVPAVVVTVTGTAPGA